MDVFDKLRFKNDNSPVNSVMMRDNPSPIHLFQKLTTNNCPVPSEQKMVKKAALIAALESFANSLKSISIDRSVIDKCFNKV